MRADAGVLGGETSEIVIKGPNIMKAYFNNAEEAVKAPFARTPRKFCFVEELPKSTPGIN